MKLEKGVTVNGFQIVDGKIVLDVEAKPMTAKQIRELFFRNTGKLEKYVNSYSLTK